MGEIIQQKIGDELQGFGGHLKCNTCRHTQELGNVGNKISNGWPQHCGYTMTWITKVVSDE